MSSTRRPPKIHTFRGPVHIFFAGLKDKDIVDGDNMEEISDPDRQDYNSYQIIEKSDGIFDYKQRNRGFDTMPITFTLDVNTPVDKYFEFLKKYDNVYSGDKIVVEAEALGAHKEYIIIRDALDGIMDDKGIMHEQLRCALRNDAGYKQPITFEFFESTGYDKATQLDHIKDIAEVGDKMQYTYKNGRIIYVDIKKKGKRSRSSGKSSSSSSSSSSGSSTSSGKGSSSSGRKSKKGKRGGKRRRTRKGNR